MVIQRLITLYVLCLCALVITAQDVKVISTGYGNSKDEAVKQALINALEETYGMFVSSTTILKNDFIESDEITTLTQGTVKKYEVLNVTQQSKVEFVVLVESLVSLEKLSSYCESKGMGVKIDGKTFGMNVKLKEFNLKNENKVLTNLCNLVNSLDHNLYDYELTVNEPFIVENSDRIYINKKWFSIYDRHKGKICVALEITPKKNINSDNLNKLFQTTIESICLSKEERKEYNSIGLSYFPSGWMKGFNEMYIRNETNAKLIKKTYNKKYENSLFAFKIVDGVNSQIYFKCLPEQLEYWSGNIMRFEQSNGSFISKSYNEKTIYVFLFFTEDEIMNVNEILIEPSQHLDGME